MKILYLDCFAGFSLEKLLGAFADLGVNSTLVERELKRIDAKITTDVIPVSRKGVEAKLAVISAPRKIIDYGSIDAVLENILNSALKNRVLRVLDIVWQSIGESYTFEYSELLYLIAVIIAEFYLEAKKCIVSPVAVTEQSYAHKILKSSNVEVFYAQNTACTADVFGSAYLGAYVGEVSAFCNYDIVKTGYGAGAFDADTPNVLRVAIADDGINGEFSELFSEEFLKVT